MNITLAFYFYKGPIIATTVKLFFFQTLATSYNKNYPINAWITSLLIASVLISLIFPILYKDKFEWNEPLWKTIFFALFMGTVFSFPVFMISYILYRKLLAKDVSTHKIKVIIFICTSILMILMFVIFGIDLFDTSDGWIIFFLYLLANFISIFVTPLQPKKSNPPE